MSVPTSERPTLTASPPQPPGRGHRARMVVLPAVAILLGAFVATRLRYQPLVVGSSQGHDATTYREGQPFSYAISLRNDGHLPVTITGIDTGDGNSLLRTTGVYVLQGASTMGTGSLKPNLGQSFPSFTLGPGQERSLLIKSVFAGCRNWSPGSSERYGALHVSFGVLGIPRHPWVDMGNFFSIAAPAACPESP